MGRCADELLTLMGVWGERLRSGPRFVAWVLSPRHGLRFAGSRVFRLGGVGGAAALPPCPPWLKWLPERSRSEAEAE